MATTIKIAKQKIRIWPLLLAILFCEAAGIIGGIATAQSVNNWYQQLEKPGFTPPNWLFGPVWTTLYLLMGVALYLVWEKRKANPAAKKALIFFLVQLVLNSLWSFSFFAMESPLTGLINILVLLVFIILTITWFFRITKPAGYLLLPYLAWVLYATALNLSIFLLN